MNGYLALAVMLSIYIGAQLVTGSLADIGLELLFATIMLVAARLVMARWLPGIGAMIVAHGSYDAFLGAPAPLPWTGPVDIFLVGFTSGTTSRPKAFARARHSWRVSLDA